MYTVSTYVLVVKSRFMNRLATGVSWKSQLPFMVKAHEFGLDAFPEHRNETDPFDGHSLWHPHNEVAPRTPCYCKKSLDLIEVVVSLAGQPW